MPVGKFTLCGVLLALSGCAEVQVQALTPDGMQPSGASGLRYYMPRPYLLVTEVPAPATTTDAGGQLPPSPAPVDVPPPGANGTAPAQAPARPNGPQAGGAAAPAKKDATPKADDSSAGGATGAAAAPSAGTDSSYQHVFNQYQVKLVYLPDLSRPMAITARSGIGAISFQPTLVDGWMLTSLQGSADSKVNETLTALASLVTAQKGPAAASGGGNSGQKGGGANPQLAAKRLLVPGLYAFEYSQDGVISTVCAVTIFDGSSSPVPQCRRDQRTPPMGAWAPISSTQK